MRVNVVNSVIGGKRALPRPRAHGWERTVRIVVNFSHKPGNNGNVRNVERGSYTGGREEGERE